MPPSRCSPEGSTWKRVSMKSGAAVRTTESSRPPAQERAQRSVAACDGNGRAGWAVTSRCHLKDAVRLPGKRLSEIAEQSCQP